MTDGCSSPPAKVVAPGTYAPTNPEQVKIYSKKPEKYEIVGTVLVPIPPDLRWDDRGRADKAFVALKTKAAAMGGNGLLLEIPDSEYDLVANTSYGAGNYNVPIRQKPERTAVAQAIHVISE